MAIGNPFEFMRRRSRSALKAELNLGVIDLTSQMNQEGKVFRDKKLDKYDQYYENKQYENMPPWDQTMSKSGQSLGVRQKSPRLKTAFAKTLAQRLTS